MTSVIDQPGATTKPTARPLMVAVRGKGAWNLARRSFVIASRFGPTPRRIERRIAEVAEVAGQWDARPSLPITAIGVRRHPDGIRRLAERGIEFPVHGLYHVDHAELTAAQQTEQLAIARGILESAGIEVGGFRAPYLRVNDATVHAVRETGLRYDASPAVSWPIDAAITTDAYARVLEFCNAMPAASVPSVPWFDDGLTRIPYSLPDDEATVDRLRITDPARIADLWRSIFRSIHERGELFTIGVHPERIGLCGPAIAGVLADARAATPGAWVARLDEIDRWWRERAAATLEAEPDGAGRMRLVAAGPAEVTILVRGFEVDGATPWADGYRRAPERRVEVETSRRPFVGVPASAPQAMSEFLRQQGFVVEVGDRATHTCAVERATFAPEDRRALLEEIEGSSSPLVRLGRWPSAAKSAVAITGDVDALTVWDYAHRFHGR